MSKIPRDIGATEFINLLKKHYSYSIIRQVGSHIRLEQLHNSANHLTIPNHNPIKIGTLSSLLKEVAKQNDKTKDKIIEKIF